MELTAHTRYCHIFFIFCHVHYKSVPCPDLAIVGDSLALEDSLKDEKGNKNYIKCVHKISNLFFSDCEMGQKLTKTWRGLFFTNNDKQQNTVPLSLPWPSPRRAPRRSPWWRSRREACPWEGGSRRRSPTREGGRRSSRRGCRTRTPGSPGRWDRRRRPRLAAGRGQVAPEILRFFCKIIFRFSWKYFLSRESILFRPYFRSLIVSYADICAIRQTLHKVKLYMFFYSISPTCKQVLTTSTHCWPSSEKRS